MRWRWIDCTEADGYTNWAPGQPNDVNGDQDCGQILATTGQWNDWTCDRTMQYICEITPKG